MPAKTRKKATPQRKRKPTTSKAQTAAKRVAATTKKTTKKLGSQVSKASKTVGKRAAKIAANPRRAVRRAAANVHETAVRAHDVGESVVTAGQLIKGAADFVDTIAQRAKERTKKSSTRSRKSR